nr:hypothetical protein Iba_scaffold642484CG0010 [Ipomoea batatas]
MNDSCSGNRSSILRYRKNIAIEAASRITSVTPWELVSPQRLGSSTGVKSSGFRICAETKTGLFELETNLQFAGFQNQSAELVPVRRRTGFEFASELVLNDAVVSDAEIRREERLWWRRVA